MDTPNVRWKKRSWQLTVTGLAPLPLVLPAWERGLLLPALDKLVAKAPAPPEAPALPESPTPTGGARC